MLILVLVSPLTGEAASRFRPFSAREIMMALHLAYPDIVHFPEYRSGDWTVLVGDVRYYFSEGRLLPEEALPEASRYASYSFYWYSWELPALQELSDEEHAELARLLEFREEHPLFRHPGIYSAIFRIRNHEEGSRRTKTIYFLGKKVDVHRDLLEDLARIEEKILKRAETDTGLRMYINLLGPVTGYNWRRIAGTHSISFHSFGAAVDFLPERFEGEQTYWRWTMKTDEYWYRTGYSRRYHPPEFFIRAFEEEGFVWGGKWFFFDTMHFEYRPEILILNGMR